ncbi:transposase [Planobispora siamensis]|uniref:Transposase IS701-like DDE domain-containing protein n=1 Tax=Planobispora siamensis TaxID=936338 RepID=A0A8J3SS96_9ACTN|nr:transposase [Planobispora siamensis]GIH97464.1 hypothetical protein Psi01_80940 [Planobispora siamensis]
MLFRVEADHPGHVGVVIDAGYDITRLAYVLRDLPAELLGRIRSDRVMRLPAPPRRCDPKGGRPPEHGGEFALADLATWPEPAVTTAPHPATTWARPSNAAVPSPPSPSFRRRAPSGVAEGLLSVSWSQHPRRCL